MTQTVTQITLLATEELDVTTDPRTTGIRDACVIYVRPTGYAFSFAARNKGNSGGAKQDHAVGGIYDALDAKCKDTPPALIPVYADKVYNKTGADEIVCYVSSGTRDAV